MATQHEKQQVVFHLGPAENGINAKLSFFTMFSGKNRDGRNSCGTTEHFTTQCNFFIYRIGPKTGLFFES